jgi:hypothetical protein
MMMGSEVEFRPHVRSGISTSENRQIWAQKWNFDRVKSGISTVEEDKERTEGKLAFTS